MKIAARIALFSLVWSGAAIAQVAPGTIPEVPASPAQGDGAQRQQRPAEELQKKTPAVDAPSNSAVRRDQMRDRDRTFDGMSKPSAPAGSPQPVPGAPMNDPAKRSPTTDPAQPSPAKAVPQPGDRG